MMKRKFATVLCVGVLTASMIVGCGGNASSSSAVSSAPAESAAQSETASAAAESSTAASDSASAATEASATEEDADKAAAEQVADLIDAIDVQERTDNTDAQCKEAKAAWDALTDAQKELVEGENADPDYFGRDTGDASPRMILRNAG